MHSVTFDALQACCAEVKKKHVELQEFEKSGAFNGLSDEPFEGLTLGNAVAAMADLLNYFQESLDSTHAALTQAKEADDVADAFEQPFEGLVTSLPDLEKQVQSAAPVTGVIEHTEEQLEKFQVIYLCCTRFLSAAVFECGLL